MKRLRTWLATMLGLLCCATVSAYDFEVDGIYYRITQFGDNPTVKVDYQGFIGNTYNDFYVGDIIIPETVSYNDVTYTVTAIGGNAFEGCNQVTSISMPSTIATIEQTAFYNCTRLAQINIPEGVTAINNYTFENCRTLTSIDLPSTIKSIGTYAFLGCSALESIELPEGVTRINAEAFSGCSNLKSINIPDGVMAINEETFYNCANLQTVTISNNITIIGTNAFAGCTALTDIAIPESVTSIGECAFYGCSGLMSVTIGNSVTRVERYAFKGCTGLVSVHIADLETWCSIQFGDYYSNPLSFAHHLYLNGEEITDLVIPESVTSIGDYAFYGCSGIINITNPNFVTNIGIETFYGTGWWNNQSDGLIYLDNLLLGYKGDKPEGEIAIKDGTKSIGNLAFSGCSGLTNITIPESVTSIGEYAFSGCSGLTNITIPESVTSIGEYAFKGCSGLTSIAIPESVTSIGNNTFYNCSNLTNITIPESVTSIGEYAFQNCSGLTSITIPESVTGIGKYAFSGCSGLTNITIPNSVTSIGAYMFENCLGLTCVTIPVSVTSIGMDAFYGCCNLKTVVNFSNLVFSKASSDYGYIAYYADRLIIADEQVGDFYFKTDNGVHYLNGYVGVNDEITLPETYNGESYKIGDEAFYNCFQVKTVINFSSLSISRGSSSNGYVGRYADRIINADEQVDDFYFRTDGDGTRYLSGYTGADEEIILPENYKGENYAIEERAFYACSNLTDITIPESVTSIGDNTFDGCSNLTNITIPNSVANIGKYAFYKCSSLMNVAIPNSVKSIENYTFYKCSSLTNVTIPNSVKIIADYAFSGCSSLKNLTMQTVSPFSVYTMSNFSTSATLTVPNGSAKAYSDMGGFWGQFASIKEEASVNISEANKWSTCALAFDTELPEGVRAFASTGMDENYVLLEEVTTLAANTPYILYAKEGYEGTLAGAVDVANYQETVTDGVLSGAIVEQEVSSGYVLQNQGYGMKFYNMNGQTFTIPAGKCWLSAFDAGGASVMMRFVGGANDIEGVFVDHPAMEGDAIYDLEGRRVETPQRGHIYIIGGQKVLKR